MIAEGPPAARCAHRAQSGEHDNTCLRPANRGGGEARFELNYAFMSLYAWQPAGVISADLHCRVDAGAPVQQEPRDLDVAHKRSTGEDCGAILQHGSGRKRWASAESESQHVMPVK